MMINKIESNLKEEFSFFSCGSFNSSCGINIIANKKKIKKEKNGKMIFFKEFIFLSYLLIVLRQLRQL